MVAAASAAKRRNIILLAEDHAELLYGLDGLLAAYGHFTVTAPGALEAIQVLQCTPVDLVLTDVDLSGGSGYDVARLAADNGIPALLMSGRADPADPQVAASGAAGILRKPFLLKAALAAVDAALGSTGGPPPGTHWEAELEELVRLVGQRDRYTYDHCLRVQRRALQLGQAVGLAAEALKALAASALLHDIGLIAVPPSILMKPGPLSSHETERIREHVVVGEALLRKAGFPPTVLAEVRSHHERWDGRTDGARGGYPYGLAGEQIPLGARIVAVAGTYDAMITPRVFRQRLTPAEALAELRRQSGLQCDPELVRLYEQLITYPT